MKTAFNTTEGGCRIDTHRVIPACTQDKCAGGRKPCPAPQRCVIPTRTSVIREFFAVYRQYRRHHSASYAARIAYGVAVLGRPF